MQNKTMQEQVKLDRKRLENYVSKDTMLVGAILYTAAIKRQLEIRLPYNLTVESDFKNTKMGYRYDF